jgi:hypothetical protein
MKSRYLPNCAVAMLIVANQAGDVAQVVGEQVPRNATTASLLEKNG